MIVDVLDLGTAEDGSPFIVMGLLSGEPFESRVEQGPVPVTKALSVVRDVAQTLSLHRHGEPHSATRTTSTGHGALRTTASATLPVKT